MTGWGLAVCADTVELLVGELVTNGFEHGEGTVVLRIRRGFRALWIDVTDDAFKPRLDALSGQPLDENGRGLVLIAGLAQAWGVTADGRGVWCALSLPVTAGETSTTRGDDHDH
ncbi:ATP-binding protein [Streptomyces sp. NPDC058953]|uniref:ATP-binding protein n=1 Tax=unclassified Streptomyces TaxID=2593676 RepID=UPI0036A5E071